MGIELETMRPLTYPNLLMLFNILILVLGFVLCTAQISSNEPENKIQGISGHDATKPIKVENMSLGKDCGNFLDPCGRDEDPPCCPPDFCLQGYCQNNTLSAIDPLHR